MDQGKKLLTSFLLIKKGKKIQTHKCTILGVIWSLTQNENSKRAFKPPKGKINISLVV